MFSSVKQFQEKKGVIINNSLFLKIPTLGQVLYCTLGDIGRKTGLQEAMDWGKGDGVEGLSR